MTLTIADAGERALIERIRARVGTTPTSITIGIGDDAAVLEPARGRYDVLTTDSLVEDVHFRRAWTGARAIGRKAVLVNLSDLAAMGARPRAFLLSLSLPKDYSLEDFDDLVDGVVQETHAAGAPLAGGNIAQSPAPVVVTITAVGSVHPRRVLTRAGARVNDELYVTGQLGAAATGLAILSSGRVRGSLSAAELSCVSRYEVPPSRVRCALRVAADRAATACVDLSDGLADAVRQIAEASGIGAHLDSGLIPIDEHARAWWTEQEADPVSQTLAGGEDYELLFAVQPRRRRAFLAATSRSGTPVTRIGGLRAGGIHLQRGEATETLSSGYQHFSRK